MTFRENEDQTKNVTDDVPTHGLGIRHLQTTVMFFGAFMAYVLRANLSIAIVAMVDKNATEPLAETYDWNEETRGYILSSFFWGYLITQIPAGVLTGRYGGHRFLCAGILVASFFSLIFPQCVYTGGWMLACANRMLQGIGQGFIFPSIFTLLGVWIPPAERSRHASLAVSAQLIGSVASTPVSGFLCSAYGWPSVFYTLGAVGCGISLVMVFLGADFPDKHRMISDNEKHYIQSSLGGAKEKIQVPWRSVFKSPPYLAAVFSMTCQSGILLTLLTEIPTFLGTVLNFDIKGDGLLSALPYLTAWILTFVFSWTCDFIISRGWLRLTTARKLFNSIAHYGQALAFVLLAFSHNTTLSVVYLTLAVGCIAGVFVGVQAGFVDLAPNFAGAIFSVSNFMSAGVGLIGPIAVGHVVTETGSAEQWKIVFCFCAALMVVGNTVYLTWGTSETQWWNWPEKYKDADDYKNKKAMEELERQAR